jgi:hypothetical protein
MTSAESVRVPLMNSLMKELEMLPVTPTITPPQRMIHYENVVAYHITKTPQSPKKVNGMIAHPLAMVAHLIVT